MAFEIFKLVGSIMVDNKAADQSLSATDSKAEGVGRTLLSGIGTAAKWGAAVVAAGVTAATALVKVATDTAATCDEIDKMSQKIGISREAYQELDYILSQNGMDVNSLQGGMKTLVNTMQSAQEGTESAQGAFDALGVSILDTEGHLRSQEDVFFDAIDALQGMENEAERNALANDLFGRSASELLPLLNSGAGSMEELRQKAHDLGLVISDDTIDAGVQLTDTIDTLKRTLSAAGVEFGSVIMPIVTDAAQFLIDEGVPVLREIIEEAGPGLSEFLRAILPPLLEIGEAVLPLIVQLLDLLTPVLQFLLVDLLAPLITLLADGLSSALDWVANTAIPWVINAVTNVVDAFESFRAKVQAVKDNVNTHIDAIKDRFSSLKAGIDEKIASIKNKVQEFQDKVQSAKDRISNFIENIKSKFQFSISWPHIPMPHFGINPSGWKIGDLLQGSIPSLSVDWYAKAMDAGRILTEPTIFGYDANAGKVLAGGEAGSETVVGTASLMSMIRSATASASGARDNEIVAILMDIQEALEHLAELQMVLYPDTLVGRLVRPMDAALGRLEAQKARGSA